MTGGRRRIRVVSAELAHEGRFLITQRRADAVLPLLWEFPGGRVREGESDAEALARALSDRLGIGVEVGEATMEVEHAYDAYDLTLAVYRATLAEGAVPEARRVEAFAWVTPEELGDYEFPGADQRTVDELVGDLE